MISNIKSFSDNPILLFLHGKDEYAQVVRACDIPGELQPNILNRLKQIKDQIHVRVTDDQLLLQLLEMVCGRKTHKVFIT